MKVVEKTTLLTSQHDHNGEDSASTTPITHSNDQTLQKQTNTNKMSSGQSSCRIIIVIILHVMMKFWKLCTTGLLILLLLYWFYGNLVTFVLFVSAILGK